MVKGNLMNIEKPCPVKWESMKIGVHSRFCDNCNKNVIDFTKKDKKEIIEYLLNNYNKKTCGRLRPSQLDFTHSDFLVTISAQTYYQKDSNFPFFLLAFGTSVLLASCGDNYRTDSQKEETEIVSLRDSQNSDKNDTSEQVAEIHKIPEVIPLEDSIEALSGLIELLPDSLSGAEPYSFVEIMPEYIGGVDSLFAFFRQNMQYPKWEKENKIEGKVYVEFVVEKTGLVKDPEIVRSVYGSKNLNKEVIRIILSMPKWKPGKHDGKEVDVKFTLPIEFKL